MDSSFFFPASPAAGPRICSYPERNACRGTIGESSFFLPLLISKSFSLHHSESRYQAPQVLDGCLPCCHPKCKGDVLSEVPRFIFRDKQKLWSRSSIFRVHKPSRAPLPAAGALLKEKHLPTMGHRTRQFSGFASQPGTLAGLRPSPIFFFFLPMGSSNHTQLFFHRPHEVLLDRGSPRSSSIFSARPVGRPVGNAKLIPVDDFLLLTPACELPSLHVRR